MNLERDPAIEYLYRDTKSFIFYVRKTEKGRKPLFLSTGERKSKYRAKEIALDLIAKWKGEVRNPEGVVLFKEVAEIVRQNKVNLRETTRDNTENQLKLLNEYFGDTPIDQVDETMWERFITDRLAQKATLSFATSRKFLNDVISRAFERRLIERKPKFRNPDKDREPKWRIFSRAELTWIRFKAAPKMSVATSHRFDLRHAITLADEEAFRRGDVTKLSWDRIDLERGTARFTKGATKNKKVRVIPISKRSLRVLKRRKAYTGASKWVFPGRGTKSHVRSFEKGFKAALARSKIGPDSSGYMGRFHDIRRSALTRMFGEHTNHLKLCYVRDVSVEVATEKYIKWTVEDLREVTG